MRIHISNHNFSVFYDKLNNTLLGIGGTHNSDKCNKDYKVIDYVWTNEEKYLLTPYVNNINRNNGLYLYTSKDGINWNISKNKPIYHGLYNSDSVKLGMVAFDTLPKILNKLSFALSVVGLIFKFLGIIKRLFLYFPCIIRI